MEQLEKYNNILEKIIEDCLKLLEEEDDIDNDFVLKNILYMTEKIIAEIGL